MHRNSKYLNSKLLARDKIATIYTLFCFIFNGPKPATFYSLCSFRMTNIAQI